MGLARMLAGIHKGCCTCFDQGIHHSFTDNEESLDVLKKEQEDEAIWQREGRISGDWAEAIV